MNQILFTDDDKKKNNKQQNYSNSNSKDIKKIITFFAIVILVFGIAIGGIYGINIYNSGKNKDKPIEKPELSLEETESEVTIIAKAEAGIDKIIYSWNDEDEEVRELEGRTMQEESMAIPNGENTLNVKVIDRIGQEIKTSKDFSKIEENSEKIEIIAEPTGKGELKIEVESEFPIEYILYKWNDEDEVKFESEDEETTSMEKSIEIKRGINTINIEVKDINGNKNNIEKKFEGKLKPEFEVYTEENKLYIKIKHYKGLKKAEIEFNEKKATYDENFRDYDANKEETEFKFALKEGENTVLIKAISNEDTEEYYRGKCAYSPQ